jgi:hypothetical protein
MNIRVAMIAAQVDRYQGNAGGWLLDAHSNSNFKSDADCIRFTDEPSALDIARSWRLRVHCAFEQDAEFRSPAKPTPWNRSFLTSEGIFWLPPTPCISRHQLASGRYRLYRPRKLPHDFVALPR